MIDDRELIEVDATDIEGGQDADGLPKTIPTAKPAAKATPKVEPNPELEEFRRRNATLQRERDEAAAAARAQYERAEALAKQNTETGEQLENRTTQALRSHWRAVTEAENRALAEHQQTLANLASQKALADAAEREFQAALEVNDPARIAQANRKMNEATAQLTLLEASKYGTERAVADAKAVIEDTRSQYEAMRTAKPAEQEPPVREEKREAEPAPKMSPEAWIDQHPRKTREWLHAHKEYVTDKAKHQDLLSFGEEWVRDYGQATLHSPQFVDALKAKFAPATEEVVEETTEEPEVAEVAEAKPATRSAPAAPVSRGTTPARASGGANSIKLTPEQYAIAPDVINAFEDLDPDLQTKFKVWSPTAARFQYDRNMKRAEKDMKGMKT